MVLVKAKVNQVKSMLSVAGARRKQSCETGVLRLRRVVLTNEEVNQSLARLIINSSSEAQKVPHPALVDWPRLVQRCVFSKNSTSC